MSGCDEKRRTGATDLGIQAEVIKVYDVKEITARGVMVTPAVAGDGAIKSEGKSLTVEEIRALLQEGEVE